MGYMVLPVDNEWDVKNNICECSNENNIQKLTVKHYLYECELFVNERKQMLDLLCEYDSNFNNMAYFYNINNLIFPHTNYSKKL